MMNEKLESRLLNYKFESAVQYLEGEDFDTKMLVNQLSKEYGNVGVITGTQANIINAVLKSIGVNFSKEETE